MEQILRLEVHETVSLDPDRLVELCVALGEPAAEALIADSIEKLACGLVSVEDAYQVGSFELIERRTTRLVNTAEKIGMTTFARVAADVAECAQIGQVTPLTATLERLRRIADKSLSAVCEMQDMSV